MKQTIIIDRLIAQLLIHYGTLPDADCFRLTINLFGFEGNLLLLDLLKTSVKPTSQHVLQAVNKKDFSMVSHLIDLGKAPVDESCLDAAIGMASLSPENNEVIIVKLILEAMIAQKAMTPVDLAAKITSIGLNNGIFHRSKQAIKRILQEANYCDLKKNARMLFEVTQNEESQFYKLPTELAYQILFFSNNTVYLDKKSAGQIIKMHYDKPVKK